MEILVGFFTIVGLAIVFALYLGRSKSVGDRWAIVWFAVCALIHIVLEGFYVVYNRQILRLQSPLAQVWKEYSLSDSRYLVSDPTVLGIEALTGFLVGPLCLLTVQSIRRGAANRHFLQIFICMCQLYGCVLYYATSYLTGFPDSHPAPQYFYGYFVLMNLPWIVVPILLLKQSYSAIKAQFSNSTLRGRKQK
jgi:cholestenol delta-isomerase